MDRVDVMTMTVFLYRGNPRITSPTQIQLHRCRRGCCCCCCCDIDTGARFCHKLSIPITVIRQITAQSSSGQITAFYVALRAHPVVMAIKRLLLKTD